jgi:hypothetical protein
MSDMNIFRPATDAEKMDYIEIGTPNVLDAFLTKMSEKMTECMKEYRPFDKYGARMDFEDQIAKFKLDLNNTVDRTKLVSKITIPSFDKYCDDDRFELVNIDNVKEDKLLDGMRTSTLTGKNFNFKSKARGNGVTIFVPLEDCATVEARYKKEKGIVKGK